MIKKVLIFVMAVVFLAGVAVAQERAVPAAIEKRAGQLRGEIQRARGDREKALLYKQLGELYAGADDMENASKEFLDALSLYDGFSEAEKLQMAIYISWADRYEDAMAILREILSKDPGNTGARVHLARTLSWAGRYDEAIGEADKVLQQSPEDREALLVKANALSWRGDRKEAEPIYEMLLAGEEDFDARLGLARARVEAGDRVGTRRNMALLEPRYDYQKKALLKLQAEVRDAWSPAAELGSSYYDDTDENRLYRYEAKYGTWAGNWQLKLWYRHTEARDPLRSNSAEEASLGAYSRLSERLSAGAGAGLGSLEGGSSSTFFTGHARADARVLKGTAGVSVARQVFTDTAQLIEKGIRYTTLRAGVAQSPADRWLLEAGFAYTDYSDDNNSRDANFMARYTLVRSPLIVNVGYRFRYLDFDRQSGGGYFDPENFLSHQAFVSLYHEGAWGYAYLEPYVGNQSFDRFGSHSSDVIAGGSGSLGIRLSGKVTVELNAEGGNFAAVSAAGFEYYMVGAKLVARL
jgi:tetratricopeptide (TPR) repeat protein